MNKKEKPMMVVWDKENGYDAKLKFYPTNVGSFKFDLPDVPLFRNNQTKKMMDSFEKEKNEIVEKAQKLIESYNESVLVWESSISFEPIVGNTYHLYDFNGKKTLSLISPNEWNNKDKFIGSYTLESDGKWKKL